MDREIETPRARDAPFFVRVLRQFVISIVPL